MNSNKSQGFTVAKVRCPRCKGHCLREADGSFTCILCGKEVISE